MRQVCEWLPTIAGTLLGALAALLLGVTGWWLNRRRRRKAVALALFFEVKFLRVDWIGARLKGSRPDRKPTFPASWRTLADTGADLFPRQLIRRLTEVAIMVERIHAEVIAMTPEGIADLRAIAARSERDLAIYAGETFDGATAEWLAGHEARFGDKP